MRIYSNVKHLTSRKSIKSSNLAAPWTSTEIVQKSTQQARLTQLNSKRLMIKGKDSGIQFLINTGSDVSTLHCKSKGK